MRSLRASPMLGVFAVFEFRYQQRSALARVTSVIFFVFTFIAVSLLSRNLTGAAHVNSPHAINNLILTIANFAIFIPVVFLSSVVLRDHKQDTAALFFTRPVTEFDYLA